MNRAITSLYNSAPDLCLFGNNLYCLLA